MSEKNGGFQLGKGSIEDDCFVLFYEQVMPKIMESKSQILTKWDQKLCPVEGENILKPKKIRYLGSGQYRLIFNFDFELSPDDQYKLNEIKTVYSNVFIIK